MEIAHTLKYFSSFILFPLKIIWLPFLRGTNVKSVANLAIDFFYITKYSKNYQYGMDEVVSLGEELVEG